MLNKVGFKQFLKFYLHNQATVLWHLHGGKFFTKICLATNQQVEDSRDPPPCFFSTEV